MSRKYFYLICCIVALSFAQGYFSPTRAQESEQPFRKVGPEGGVADNRSGTDKTIGQAWGDYDNDGWLDLYVTDTQGPNTLYHNNKDGSFSESVISIQVSLPQQISGGASFVDFDNDGWRDLYVLNWGPNTLFRNLGGTGFENVTGPAGVGNPDNGKTAAWGDYDRDGFLDLYVVNWACYPECGRPSTGDSDRLYHNNGDGTFSDVTALLGGKTRGAGFVAAFTDFDNDGDPDIYLVNDEFINPIGNVLWRNDGPGCEGWCFTEIAEEAGADTQLMGMGLATGDYDNDGDLDFYFSNAGPMTMLQNQGDGTFSDVAEAVGVDATFGIGWGTVFFDYDNDGWQDLYLAVAEARGKGGTSENPLFHNEGDGTFTNMGEASGAADPGATLGVAYADYDRDGWVDLVIGNIDSGYALYHNEGALFSENQWLAVRLEGRDPVNRDAIGARVFVEFSNGMTQLQEVRSGSSLGAGDPTTLYFGLDSEKEVKLRVVWPDGTEDEFPSVQAGQEVLIIYGAPNSHLASVPIDPFSLFIIGITLLIFSTAIIIVRK